MEEAEKDPDQPLHKKLLRQSLRQYFSTQLRLPGPWRNLSQIQFSAQQQQQPAQMDSLLRLFCKWDAIEFQNIFLSYHRLRYEQQKLLPGPTAASTAVFQGKKVMRFRPLKRSLASPIRKKRRAKKANKTVTAPGSSKQ
jgi:hypothetical protein